MVDSLGREPQSAVPANGVQGPQLSTFYFFYFAVLGVLLPYWPLYLEHVGLHAEEIAWLAALLAATKIIAPNIWGWLGDTSGYRMRIIRLGSALACLGFAGIFVSQAFWWLCIVVLLYSFFWNAVLPQFEVITLGQLGDNYQDYSRIRLWGSVGFIIAVASLGYLFDTLDLLTLDAVPVILVSLFVCIWLSSLTVREADSFSVATAPVAIRETLFQPHILAFFAVCFLVQLSHGPYYTFFSLYLEKHGYDTATIGLLWTLGVAAEVLFFMKVADLFVHYSLRRLLLACLVFTAIRWALIAWYTDVLWVLLFAQLLHAASFACFHSVAIEYVRRFFRSGQQGRGQALYSSISYGAGGALGALMAGYFWAISPASSFLAASVAAIIAIFVVAYWLGEENLV